jgi:hypothetical protein
VAESRELEARATLHRPRTREQMSKRAVPQPPFTEWGVPCPEVRFHDARSCLLRRWTATGGQGNHGFFHRAPHNPWHDVFHPVPVHGLNVLRDGIRE